MKLDEIGVFCSGFGAPQAGQQTGMNRLRNFFSLSRPSETDVFRKTDLFILFFNFRIWTQKCIFAVL